MPETRTSERRVLLVDADPVSATFFAGHLRESGFPARVVGSGAAAIRACEEQAPDLLILDSTLPDIDGFALWPRLASCCDPIPPFLFLTASADFESAEKGLSLGAKDYLVKRRTSSADLAACVERGLGSLRKERRPLLRILN